MLDDEDFFNPDGGISAIDKALIVLFLILILLTPFLH